MTDPGGSTHRGHSDQGPVVPGTVGTCPICGMALEPEIAGGESGPNAELAYMTRRFSIGLALTLPVLLLEMGGHLLPALHRLVPPGGFGLDTAGVRHAGGTVGGPAVLRARLGIAAHTQPQHVHADLDGDGRRLGLQRGRDPCAVHLPGGVPGHGRLGRGLFRGRGGHHRAGAAGPGHLGRDQGAARPGPENGAAGPRRRKRGGGGAGTDRRRRPVARAPGRESAGRCAGRGRALGDRRIDGDRRIHARSESTGRHGDRGTLNQSGALLVRAEKIGRDTMLSRIVHMVADAQRSRAPIQRLVDQVSGWFVPVVVLIAAVAFVVWASGGRSHGWRMA